MAETEKVKRFSSLQVQRRGHTTPSRRRFGEARWVHIAEPMASLQSHLVLAPGGLVTPMIKLLTSEDELSQVQNPIETSSLAR